MAKVSSENLHEKLFGMLSSAALVRGHKRRASALDVTDFEAAFDDLINPRSRPAWMDCAADIGLLLGGGFVGAGTNILTASGERAQGWIAVLAGAFVGIFCIVIKYVKYS
jgi:hypothetical protein